MAVPAVRRPSGERRQRRHGGVERTLVAREVERFHAAALAHQGASEGAPGLRPHYDADFYAAYVRDPDGNELGGGAAVRPPRRSESGPLEWLEGSGGGAGDGRRGTARNRGSVRSAASRGGRTAARHRRWRAACAFLNMAGAIQPAAAPMANTPAAAPATNLVGDLIENPPEGIKARRRAPGDILPPPP